MSSASIRPLASTSAPPQLAPTSAPSVPLSAESLRLAALVFAQMLPATLVAPAVRPLFALHHAGREGGMHAFMSVNMGGAVVAALVLAVFPRLRELLARRMRVLLVADALALLLVAAPLPMPAILGLRTLEGAVHVTTATMLFTLATRRARERGDRRGLAAAGAAITVAVALGHLVGGALVRMDPRAPFLVGALLLGAVLPWTLGRSRLVAGAADVNELSMASPVGRREPLWLAVAAAFVARFTVGCLVVSFALFVHKAHAIDDGRIGMLFAAMTIPFAAATYPAGVIVSRGLRASLLVASCAVYGALLATLSRLPGNALALAMMGMGVASAFLFASLLSLATSGRTGPARTRAISLVNGAGCLGMLVGPACSGIACAVLRAPDAPLRGYLASFAIAAGAVAAFLLVASPWLLPRAVRELADRPRVG